MSEAIPVTREIKLGNTVKDAVTGFTGIAHQMVEELNGNVRWTIQPKIVDPSVYPDAVIIDANMIDFVDDGLAHRVPAIPETPFKLGDRVKETTNGYIGIITARCVFINGCVIFTVCANAKKQGKKFGEVNNISWERLEKLGEIKKVKKAAETGSGTGGPTLRGALRAN